MINDFQNIVFELYGYLVQLRDIFRSNDIGSEQIPNVDNIIELLQTRKFNVAVVGEFKRGKSSLINAILGMKILPSDVTPATATINRITYGSEPSLTIHYHDGSVEDAYMEDISNYVTMLTEEGQRRAELIKEAVIRYPSVICQNSVDIIDTPGLNDNPQMTKITLELLQDIDVVLVTVSAIAPFSNVEKELVCQILKSDNIENIIFVVTFIDLIDEEEQDQLISYVQKRIRSSVFDSLSNETEETMEKFSRIMNNPLIYGVSSHLALNSFISNNHDLLKKSRFGTFKTELYELLTSQQGFNMIVKAVRGIRSTSTNFETACSRKISLIEAEIAEVNEQLGLIKSYAGECVNLFHEEIEASGRYLNECIQNIAGLKRLFAYYFSVLNSLPMDDWNQIAAVVNTGAHKCWVAANETYSEIIINQVNFTYTQGLEKFMLIRKRRLLQPLQVIEAKYRLDVNYSDSFNTDIKEVTGNSDFPRFAWMETSLTGAPTKNRNKIIKNIDRAINISVNRMSDHWIVYLNHSREWWTSQLEQEASSICSGTVSQVSEILERKQNELALLKSLLDKHRVTIQEIRQKTDRIYSEILDADLGTNTNET